MYNQRMNHTGRLLQVVCHSPIRHLMLYSIPCRPQVWCPLRQELSNGFL